MFLRSGKVAVQHIEIEEAVVVEVGETSAPRPTGLHHGHGGRYNAGNLLKFSVGNAVVKPVARGGFNEHFF